MLLVGATLLVSGCWWAVVDYDGGAKRITLTQDFTNRLIWSCTAEAGSGSSRAFCVFDRIEGVCHTFPNAYVYQSDCSLLSNYGDWQDMEAAIKKILQPAFGGDCLTYWVNPPPCVIDCYPNNPQPNWGTAVRGQWGCA